LDNTALVLDTFNTDSADNINWLNCSSYIHCVQWPLNYGIVLYSDYHASPKTEKEGEGDCNGICQYTA